MPKNSSNRKALRLPVTYRTIYSVKNNGQICAGLISLVLIVPCVCVALPIEGILSSTESENADAPLTFNAVRQYTKGDDVTANEYWRYEFATDCSNLQWQEITGKDTWGAWGSRSLGYSDASIPSNGNIWFQNRMNTMDDLDIPALAYKFTAPFDGEMTLQGVATALGTSTEGFNCLVRVTKNGENIYPTTDWADVLLDNPIDFSGVKIQVSKGDLIRFEITVNQHMELNETARVNWNPCFMLQSEQGKYSSTDNVLNKLTNYMYELFSGKESQTMDGDSADTRLGAANAARDSVYGVYSASDTVYEDGIGKSGEGSVWKFAVLPEHYKNFQIPTADFGVTYGVEGNTFNIDWNDEVCGNVTAAHIIYGDGSSDKFTTFLDLIDIALPDGTEEFRLQLSSDGEFSQIITMNYSSAGWQGSEITATEPIYLNTQTVTDSGKLSNNITLEDSAVNSKYVINYSKVSANSADDLKYQRAVRFYSAENENMRLGFTAPVLGEYQISAPIEAEDENAGVKFAILKTDTYGNTAYIKNYEDYTQKEDFCNLQVSLEKGETVWLDAVSDKAAIVNIGIPKAICTSYYNQVDSSTAYTYKAVEYFESPYATGDTYGVRALTENSGSVWSFGYFNNPVVKEDDTNNYDSLKLANLAVGDSAEKLINALTPYELTRGGIYYNSLLNSENTDGSLTTYGAGRVGVMYPAMGNDVSGRLNLGLPKRCKGIYTTIGYATIPKTGELANIGVYMKFTAPVSGNATLRLTDDVSADAVVGNRYLIIKNGEVAGIYKSSVKAGEVLDLGVLNVGDTVVLCDCYTIEKTMSAARCVGNPSITIIGERYAYSLSDNGKNGGFEGVTLVGNTVNMPSKSARIGSRLVGWKNNTTNEVLTVGESSVITQDTDFTAIYEYYGDLDGDNSVTAFDMSVLRDYFMNGGEENVNSDVNLDGKINAVDIVRIKKWLAGVTTILGE